MVSYSILSNAYNENAFATLMCFKSSEKPTPMKSNPNVCYSKLRKFITAKCANLLKMHFKCTISNCSFDAFHPKKSGRF